MAGHVNHMLVLDSSLELEPEIMHIKPYLSLEKLCRLVFSTQTGIMWVQFVSSNLSKQSKLFKHTCMHKLLGYTPLWHGDTHSVCTPTHICKSDSLDN